MICVSESDLTIIKSILQEYVPDCEVWAFGSRYKWTAKKYSDLDIAVIGKERINLEQIGNMRDAFAESNLPFRVDVLDWQGISKEFQAIIKSGYEVIYSPE
jgi:type I restriction enzyme S subunit